MKDPDKVLMECYRDIYAHSTPKANFDELLDNANINERGQKEIPFMDYEIEESTFEGIVNKVLDKNKVKNTYDRRRVFTTLYLGCSPKFKRND